MAKYILELPKEVQADIFNKEVNYLRDCCGAEYIQEEYGLSVEAFVSCEVMREKLVNILDLDFDCKKYGLTYENYKQYL